MLKSMSKRHAAGHSLVEVMVAIAVFAIGLLGVAAMMMQATRATTNALSRSQAAILSSYIVERMRSNPVAVEAGIFDAVTISGEGDASGGSACTGATAGCSPAAIAAADIALWRDQAAAALPGLEGTLQCSLSAGLRQCEIALSWAQSLNRRELEAGATDSFATETYTLAFAP